MKLTSLVSAGAAVLVGSFGAFVGYQSVMGEPTWLNTAAEESGDVPAPVAPTPKVKIKLRDCPRGFEQVKQECVRTVERTVTVPVEVVVPPPAAPAPVYVGDDEAGDDRGGDRDRGGRGDDRGDRGDDRGDDHAGNDDRDDHGDDDNDEHEDHEENNNDDDHEFEND